MAPKKKTTKAAPAPPPPPKKIPRIDIILDQARQEIMKNLCDKTGIKANTKALFFAAEHFLNIKPLNEKKIKELVEENDVLKRELYLAKQAINNFTHSFDEMKNFVNTDLPFASGRPAANSFGRESAFNDMVKSNNHSDVLCPHCSAVLNEDDIEDEFCPECEEDFDRDDLNL